MMTSDPQMIPMVSLVAHRYDARDLDVGDEFEAELRYVPFLKHLGRAAVRSEFDPGQQVKTKDLDAGTYDTRVMTPDSGSGVVTKTKRPARPAPRKRKNNGKTRRRT